MAIKYTYHTSHHPTETPTLSRHTQRAVAKSPPKLLEGEPGCHALETLRGRIGLLALILPRAFGGIFRTEVS